MILARLLSAQPTTNMESWKLKFQMHLDQWHEDAYGQNPAPFYRQPGLAERQGPPYPWQPLGELAPSFDSLYPSNFSFGVDLDLSSYPASIGVIGNVPVNQPDGGTPPQTPLQATTANTGGSIPPGTYSIKISAHGNLGPVSSTVVAVVPVGTSTNTITVSGIVWPGASAGPAVYIGPNVMAMKEMLVGYSGSSPDSYGNPTTFVITALPSFGAGLPDRNFKTFVVEQVPIEHGGAWGAAVTSATNVSGQVLTFAGAAWTVNQWAGRVLSLYYRPSVTPQPMLNLTVVSNTSNTLTMSASSVGGGFAADDVVVMRLYGAHITASTIGDDNLINSFAPSGLDVSGTEKGRLIQIIYGTGAGQPPKTILSNTSTVYTIAGTWDVTPDSTSIWIVTSATPAPLYQSKPVTNNGSSPIQCLVATTSAFTEEFQSLLIQVATADEAGNFWPLRYQPFREVYVPVQKSLDGRIVATTPYDVQASDDVLTFVAGASVVNLPPLSDLIRKTLWLINASAVSVTINTFAGDTLDGATSVQLAPGSRWQVMPNV